MNKIKIFYDMPSTYFVQIGNRKGIYGLFYSIIFQVGKSGNLYYQGGRIQGLYTKSMLNLDLPTLDYEYLPAVIKAELIERM